MTEDYYRGFLDRLYAAGLLKSGGIFQTIKETILDKMKELSPAQRRIKWLQLINKQQANPYVE